MARRVGLETGWELRGYRCHGGGEMDVNMQVDLPLDVFSQLQLGEGDEWALLRRFCLHKRILQPSEPEEGHSERYFLSYMGVRGGGSILLGDKPAASIEGEGQVELSSALISGECDVAFCFSPAVEKGFGGLPKIMDAPVLRATYFARFIEVSALPACDGSIQVRALVEGFGEGRVRFRYRVTKNEELVASSNMELRITARRQWVQQSLFVEDAARWDEEGAVYTLHLSMERGGARCDMEEISLGFCDKAAFLSRPLHCIDLGEGGQDMQAILQARQLGFDAAVLRTLPGEGMLRMLDAGGLALVLMLEEGGLDGVIAAMHRLPNHPCMLGLGLGGVRFADGSPADFRHPSLARLVEAAKGYGLEPLQEQRFAGAVLSANEPALSYQAIARQRALGRGLLFVPDPGFFAQGAFVREKAMLKAALGPLAVAFGARPGYLYPGAVFCAELELLAGSGGMAMVQAQLYKLNGEQIGEGAYSLLATSKETARASFAQQLPWNLDEALLLRLHAYRGDALLWRWDELLYCGENHEKTLPRAEVALARKGEQWYAINRGPVVAVGLCLVEESALCALLPGERIAAGSLIKGVNFTLDKMEDA